jgi:rod shape-determining protein MreC
MRKRLLIALAGCLLFSIIILLTRSSAPSLFIQGVFQSIYQSPKEILYAVVMKTNEHSEIEKVRKENRMVRDQLTELKRLQADNEALRAQFENETISPDSLLPAEIIGFHGSMASPEVLIINKGKRDEVKTGQPIIIENNLVGVVDSVGERYSSVLVVTNPKFTTVAKTDSQDVLGIIQGGGEKLLLDKVAITDELKNGQTIITRGTVEESATGIPPNLVIGVIESVRKVESEPFQSAQVKSLVNTAHLTRIFILQ